jgi:hypothetical protein
VCQNADMNQCPRFMNSRTRSSDHFCLIMIDSDQMCLDMIGRGHKAFPANSQQPSPQHESPCHLLPDLPSLPAEALREGGIFL